jgi:N-methylhydantoinase A
MTRSDRTRGDLRIGIDVGGTFTDLLVAGPRLGRRTWKTSSTPEDPTDGVVAGLETAAAGLGMPVGRLLADTAVIVHGTTITTNALLTRTGATVGLITTDGFRDTLLLRQGRREHQFDGRRPQPAPLVPRWRVHGVPGRVDSRGAEMTPLDEDAVRLAAARLRSDGVGAVAVALMFAHLRPAHERRVRELLHEELPGVHVSLSSDVAPVVRLYDRTSTTVLDAYVSALLARYLDRLEGRLEGLGFHGRLAVMQSNGGSSAPALVRRRAVSTLLSGPAGGPVGAHAATAHLGLPRVLTVDMGGTSFEVSQARDGETAVRPTGELEGELIAAPMLDISTLGAGGGSIAFVDAGGMLQVGPRSAGSRPGPACFGRGGTQPTVTDAALLLGYLAPGSMAASDVPLSPARAADAMGTLADALGIGPMEAAAGVLATVNAAMADRVRLETVGRGEDPRDFALVAAGGAGPVHAGALAEELEIPLVLVPPEGSVLCATGMLAGDIVHHHVRALQDVVSRVSPAAVDAALAAMEAAARAELREEGIDDDRVALLPSVELRYVDQLHELPVPLPGPGEPIGVRLERAVERFAALHEERYGHALPGVAVELVTVRLEARGRTDPLPPTRVHVHGPATARAHRSAWFDGAHRDTPVHVLGELPTGARVQGPALVELRGSTLVVGPSRAVTVDPTGLLALHAADVTLDEVARGLVRGEVARV